MTELETIQYYDRNAEAYEERTMDLDMQGLYRPFLDRLPSGARILDLGCGPGRDSAYFLSKGYAVDAADGSAAFCEAAKERTGLPVRHMQFSDLCAKEEYDGIWACASLLHIPSEKLAPLFQRMSDAIKEGGVIYASFKYGTFEGDRDGRHFTDLTEESFSEILRAVPSLRIQETWRTGDLRPERNNQWLNLILHKR